MSIRNIRMLTAQRELTEKERLKEQGVEKARRNQEMDTQDVAKKTNTSESERAAKKAKSDFDLASAESALADKKATNAAIGAAIGFIGAIAAIAGAAANIAAKAGEEKKAQRDEGEGDTGDSESTSGSGDTEQAQTPPPTETPPPETTQVESDQSSSDPLSGDERPVGDDGGGGEQNPGDSSSSGGDPPTGGDTNPSTTPGTTPGDTTPNPTGGDTNPPDPNASGDTNPSTTPTSSGGGTTGTAARSEGSSSDPVERAAQERQAQESQGNNGPTALESVGDLLGNLLVLLGLSELKNKADTSKKEKAKKARAGLDTAFAVAGQFLGGALSYVGSQIVNSVRTGAEVAFAAATGGDVDAVRAEGDQRGRDLAARYESGNQEIFDRISEAQGGNTELIAQRQSEEAQARAGLDGGGDVELLERAQQVTTDSALLDRATASGADINDRSQFSEQDVARLESLGVLSGEGTSRTINTQAATDKKSSLGTLSNSFSSQEIERLGRLGVLSGEGESRTLNASAVGSKYEEVSGRVSDLDSEIAVLEQQQVTEREVASRPEGFDAGEFFSAAGGQLGRVGLGALRVAGGVLTAGASEGVIALASSGGDDSESSSGPTPLREDVAQSRAEFLGNLRETNPELAQQIEDRLAANGGDLGAAIEEVRNERVQANNGSRPDIRSTGDLVEAARGDLQTAQADQRLLNTAEGRVAGLSQEDQSRRQALIDQYGSLEAAKEAVGSRVTDLESRISRFDAAQTATRQARGLRGAREDLETARAGYESTIARTGEYTEERANRDIDRALDDYAEAHGIDLSQLSSEQRTGLRNAIRSGDPAQVRAFLQTQGLNVEGIDGLINDFAAQLEDPNSDLSQKVNRHKEYQAARSELDTAQTNLHEAEQRVVDTLSAVGSGYVSSFNFLDAITGEYSGEARKAEARREVQDTVQEFTNLANQPRERQIEILQSLGIDIDAEATQEEVNQKIEEAFSQRLTALNAEYGSNNVGEAFASINTETLAGLAGSQVGRNLLQVAGNSLKASGNDEALGNLAAAFVIGGAGDSPQAFFQSIGLTNNAEASHAANVQLAKASINSTDPQIRQRAENYLLTLGANELERTIDSLRSENPQLAAQFVGRLADIAHSNDGRLSNTKLDNILDILDAGTPGASIELLANSGSTNARELAQTRFNELARNNPVAAQRLLERVSPQLAASLLAGLTQEGIGEEITGTEIAARLLANIEKNNPAKALEIAGKLDTLNSSALDSIIETGIDKGIFSVAGDTDSDASILAVAYTSRLTDAEKVERLSNLINKLDDNGWFGSELFGDTTEAGNVLAGLARGNPALAAKLLASGNLEKDIVQDFAANHSADFASALKVGIENNIFGANRQESLEFAVNLINKLDDNGLFGTDLLGGDSTGAGNVLNELGKLDPSLAAELLTVENADGDRLLETDIIQAAAANDPRAFASILKAGIENNIFSDSGDRDESLAFAVELINELDDNGLFNTDAFNDSSAAGNVLNELARLDPSLAAELFTVEDAEGGRLLENDIIRSAAASDPEAFASIIEAGIENNIFGANRQESIDFAVGLINGLDDNGLFNTDFLNNSSAAGAVLNYLDPALAAELIASGDIENDIIRAAAVNDPAKFARIIQAGVDNGTFNINEAVEIINKLDDNGLFGTDFLNNSSAAGAVLNNLSPDLAAELISNDNFEKDIILAAAANDPAAFARIIEAGINNDKFSDNRDLSIAFATSLINELDDNGLFGTDFLNNSSVAGAVLNNLDPALAAELLATNNIENDIIRAAAANDPAAFARIIQAGIDNGDFDVNKAVEIINKLDDNGLFNTDFLGDSSAAGAVLNNLSPELAAQLVATNNIEGDILRAAASNDPQAFANILRTGIENNIFGANRQESIAFARNIINDKLNAFIVGDSDVAAAVLAGIANDPQLNSDRALLEKARTNFDGLTQEEKDRLQVLQNELGVSLINSDGTKATSFNDGIREAINDIDEQIRDTRALAAEVIGSDGKGIENSILRSLASNDPGAFADILIAGNQEGVFTANNIRDIVNNLDNGFFGDFFTSSRDAGRVLAELARRDPSLVADFIGDVETDIFNRFVEQDARAAANVITEGLESGKLSTRDAARLISNLDTELAAQIFNELATSDLTFTVGGQNLTGAELVAKIISDGIGEFDNFLGFGGRDDIADILSELNPSVAASILDSLANQGQNGVQLATEIIDEFDDDILGAQVLGKLSSENISKILTADAADGFNSILRQGFFGSEERKAAFLASLAEDGLSDGDIRVLRQLGLADAQGNLNTSQISSILKDGTVEGAATFLSAYLDRNSQAQGPARDRALQDVRNVINGLEAFGPRFLGGDNDFGAAVLARVLSDTDNGQRDSIRNDLINSDGGQFFRNVLSKAGDEGRGELLSYLTSENGGGLVGDDGSVNIDNINLLRGSVFVDEDGTINASAISDALKAIAPEQAARILHELRQLEEVGDVAEVEGGFRLQSRTGGTATGDIVNELRKGLIFDNGDADQAAAILNAYRDEFSNRELAELVRDGLNSGSLSNEGLANIIKEDRDLAKYLVRNLVVLANEAGENSFDQFADIAQLIENLKGGFFDLYNDDFATDIFAQVLTAEDQAKIILAGLQTGTFNRRDAANLVSGIKAEEGSLILQAIANIDSVGRGEITRLETGIAENEQAQNALEKLRNGEELTRDEQILLRQVLRLSDTADLSVVREDLRKLYSDEELTADEQTRLRETFGLSESTDLSSVGDLVKGKIRDADSRLAEDLTAKRELLSTEQGRYENGEGAFLEALRSQDSSVERGRRTTRREINDIDRETRRNQREIDILEKLRNAGGDLSQLTISERAIARRALDIDRDTRSVDASLGGTIDQKITERDLRNQELETRRDNLTDLIDSQRTERRQLGRIDRSIARNDRDIEALERLRDQNGDLTKLSEGDRAVAQRALGIRGDGGTVDLGVIDRKITETQEETSRLQESRSEISENIEQGRTARSTLRQTERELRTNDEQQGVLTKLSTNNGDLTQLTAIEQRLARQLLGIDETVTQVDQTRLTEKSEELRVERREILGRKAEAETLLTQSGSSVSSETDSSTPLHEREDERGRSLISIPGRGILGFNSGDSVNITGAQIAAEILHEIDNDEASEYFKGIDNATRVNIIQAGVNAGTFDADYIADNLFSAFDNNQTREFLSELAESEEEINIEYSFWRDLTTDGAGLAAEIIRNIDDQDVRESVFGGLNAETQAKIIDSGLQINRDKSTLWGLSFSFVGFSESEAAQLLQSERNINGREAFANLSTQNQAAVFDDIGSTTIGAIGNFFGIGNNGADQRLSFFSGLTDGARRQAFIEEYERQNGTGSARSIFSDANQGAQQRFFTDILSDGNIDTQERQTLLSLGLAELADPTAFQQDLDLVRRARAQQQITASSTPDPSDPNSFSQSDVDRLVALGIINQDGQVDTQKADRFIENKESGIVLNERGRRQLLDTALLDGRLDERDQQLFAEEGLGEFEIRNGSQGFRLNTEYTQSLVNSVLTDGVLDPYDQQILIDAGLANIQNGQVVLNSAAKQAVLNNVFQNHTHVFRDDHGRIVSASVDVQGQQILASAGVGESDVAQRFGGSSYADPIYRSAFNSALAEPGSRREVRTRTGLEDERATLEQLARNFRGGFTVNGTQVGNDDSNLILRAARGDRSEDFNQEEKTRLVELGLLQSTSDTTIDRIEARELLERGYEEYQRDGSKSFNESTGNGNEQTRTLDQVLLGRINDDIRQRQERIASLEAELLTAPLVPETITVSRTVVGPGGETFTIDSERTIPTRTRDQVQADLDRENEGLRNERQRLGQSGILSQDGSGNYQFIDQGAGSGVLNKLTLAGVIDYESGSSDVNRPGLIFTDDRLQEVLAQVSRDDAVAIIQGLRHSGQVSDGDIAKTLLRDPQLGAFLLQALPPDEAARIIRGGLREGTINNREAARALSQLSVEDQAQIYAQISLQDSASGRRDNTVSNILTSGIIGTIYSDQLKATVLRATLQELNRIENNPRNRGIIQRAQSSGLSALSGEERRVALDLLGVSRSTQSDLTLLDRARTQGFDSLSPAERAEARVLLRLGQSENPENVDSITAKYNEILAASLGVDVDHLDETLSRRSEQYLQDNPVERGAQARVRQARSSIIDSDLADSLDRGFWSTLGDGVSDFGVRRTRDQASTLTSLINSNGEYNPEDLRALGITPRDFDDKTLLFFNNTSRFTELIQALPPEEAARALLALSKTRGFEGYAAAALQELDPERAAEILNARDQDGNLIISDTDRAYIIREGINTGKISAEDAAKILSRAGDRVASETLEDLSNIDPNVAQAIYENLDEGQQARVDARLSSDAEDRIHEAGVPEEEQIGGSKVQSSGERISGFNALILVFNAGLAGIQFMLEQLDKMREAQELKQEAEAKKSAAMKLYNDLMKELKRQNAIQGADAGAGDLSDNGGSGSNGI